MDDPTMCADVVTEGVVHKQNSCGQICKESCNENKQLAASNADGMILPLKGVNVLSISEKDDATLEVLGIALSDVLNVDDTHERFLGCSRGLDQDLVYCQKDMQSLSLVTQEEKGLSSTGTALSMEDGTRYPLFPTNGKEDLSKKLHNESFAEDESPALATLTVTVKLVSAMKGGREREGMPLKSKLNVKWAPDVYDPPVTSSSHTVKGRHYHMKAKRKDHCKHKHNKGRSLRGSSSDRKHTTWRSTCNLTDPWTSRFQAHGNGLVLNGFDRSKVEGLDYKIVSHELKCGSNYYTEPLASMHLPFTEAS